MAGETYLSAGVDLQGLEALKERIGAYSRSTQQVVMPGASRGFAGLFPLQGYRTPVLVASADGVGTKLKIASLLGHWEGIGTDLVNLNVNDALTWGARPLFFLDYISMGDLDAQTVETLVRGMAWACRQVNCALIGGETAQMPGLYRNNDLDLAGFLVGCVEQDQLLDGASIAPGDALLGVPSSGLHTNGYSLVRRVFGIDDDPSVLYKHYPELGHTLGEELLVPHRSYYPLLEPVLHLIKGMAHITGGGLPGKLPRVLSEGLGAQIQPGSWHVPPIFSLIQHTGQVADQEMFQVFNMGLGMVLVCAPDRASDVQACLPEAVVMGQVVRQGGPQRVLFQQQL